jgi:hypothetical protein
MSVMSESRATDVQSLTYEILGRAADREPCRLKVRFRECRSLMAITLHDGQDVFRDGWIRNRSSLGIMLETESPAQAGKQMEIYFSSADGKTTWLALATVCWVQHFQGTTHRMGLKFESLHQL